MIVGTCIIYNNTCMTYKFSLKSCHLFVVFVIAIETTDYLNTLQEQQLLMICQVRYWTHQLLLKFMCVIVGQINCCVAINVT